MAITTAQIQQLYVAYLGRAADKAGLDYWANELNTVPATLTLENLRANFVNEQAEYKAIYGGLSREDSVVKIYNNLFGRAPDADGLAYWTTGAGASVNADQLLVAFVNGAGAADAKTIANKVLVSEVYTSTAGDKFNVADAKEMIKDVTDDNTTVTGALEKLSDGTLPGISLPAGVAALKALDAANAAEVSFETSKVADLNKIATQLDALNKNTDAADAIKALPVKDYASVDAAVDAALAAARGATDTTENLTTALTDANTAATAAVKALADARTAALIEEGVLDVPAKLSAYDAAVKAVAANKAPVLDDVTQAKAVLDAYAANSANSAAFVKAVADAGLAPGANATAVYDALVAGNATAIAKITTAFSGIASFGDVKSLAAKQAASDKALDALDTATENLDTTAGNAWITKYNEDAAAKVAVVDAKAALDYSKALDGIEGTDNSLHAAHDAATGAADDAQDAVDALNGKGLVVAADAAGDDAKAEVFHFATKVAQTDDFAINFGAKDSLYLGDGYTLNKTGTVDASGHIAGNNNALEVFFINDKGVIKAVVETTAFGSSTADLKAGALPATTDVDNVAVITLTGVTDVSQVSFANGVITSHVA